MYRTVTDFSSLKKLFEMIAVAVFLDSLDGSIVNIALPTIMEVRFRITGGFRRFFCAGFVVFTVCSVACCFAPYLVLLVVYRAVQGVGTVMIAFVEPLLVVQLMPPTPLVDVYEDGGYGWCGCAGVRVGYRLCVMTEFLSWH